MGNEFNPQTARKPASAHLTQGSAAPCGAALQGTLVDQPAVYRRFGSVALLDESDVEVDPVPLFVAFAFELVEPVALVPVPLFIVPELVAPVEVVPDALVEVDSVVLGIVVVDSYSVLLRVPSRLQPPRQSPAARTAAAAVIFS